MQYLLCESADGDHALGAHSEDLSVELDDATDGGGGQLQVQRRLRHAESSTVLYLAGSDNFCNSKRI